MRLKHETLSTLLNRPMRNKTSSLNKSQKTTVKEALNISDVGKKMYSKNGGRNLSESLAIIYTLEGSLRRAGRKRGKENRECMTSKNATFVFW